jgi:hypothetical protein
MKLLAANPRVRSRCVRSELFSSRYSLANDYGTLRRNERNKLVTSLYRHRSGTMLRRSLPTVNICREPHRYRGVILARISALTFWMHSSDCASVSSLPSYIFTQSHDAEFVLSPIA